MAMKDGGLAPFATSCRRRGSPRDFLSPFLQPRRDLMERGLNRVIFEFRQELVFTRCGRFGFLIRISQAVRGRSKTIRCHQKETPPKQGVWVNGQPRLGPFLQVFYYVLSVRRSPAAAAAARRCVLDRVALHLLSGPLGGTYCARPCTDSTRTNGFSATGKPRSRSTQAANTHHGHRKPTSQGRSHTHNAFSHRVEDRRNHQQFKCKHAVIPY